MQNNTKPALPGNLTAHRDGSPYQKSHSRVGGANRPCEPKRSKRGFTLLEVIVSMAILTLLIIVVSNMFQQVSNSWNIGVDRAEALGAGRAALELMTRELSSAVCDSTFVFKITDGDGPETYYGEWPDRINFVSFCGQPSQSSGARAIREVCYYIAKDADDRFNLMRGVKSTGLTVSPHCYSGDSAWTAGLLEGNQVMIEDVADLQFFAFDSNGNEIAGYQSWDVANDNSFPAYVDIYMEVLGNTHATRATALAESSPALVEEYVNRNSRRFTTRVYFVNRDWKP